MNYPNYYAPAAPQVPMYNPAMYNPAFGAAQARLTQMEQQYPQFAQQQPVPPATQTQAPMPQGLNARAVTSKLVKSGELAREGTGKSTCYLRLK